MKSSTVVATRRSVESTQSSSGRRPLVLALAVVGALAVAAAVWFLLGSGAAAPIDTSPVPRGVAAPQPTSTTPVKEKANDSYIVPARDPFLPIVKPAVAQGSSGAAVVANTKSVPVTTAAHVAKPKPTVKPTPKATATPKATPVGTTYVLRLVTVDATAQTAAGTINGNKVTFELDKPVAKGFRLYSVFGDSCAGILFKDQNLALCTGEARTVTG